MPFIKSIRTKALLSVLIPMLVVLFAVAVITLYTYESEAQEIVKHRDTELARMSAARISDGLSQYSQILQQIALEDDIQSMEPARLSSALEKAQSRLYVFDAGVVVYDSDGVALLSQSFVEERQGTIFPTSSEFTKVRETLRPVFSNIIEDTYSGEDVILICVPIIGNGSEFKGVLVGMCTLKYSLLGSMYVEMLEFKGGLSGYAYLVDGNGRVIYHRHSSEVGRDLGATIPVMQVTGGETSAVLTEDSQGETIISGFAPVPGTDWGVITCERWENIFGPIRGYSNLLLGLLVLGGIISSVLIFFVISRILRPIHDLTTGAQRIAGGDFDPMIVPRSGDEMQTLAQQFNTMADTLKEHTAALNEEITERRQAEETLQHLSLVLRAIRNVNQLITKEKDRNKLLKGACDNLIETRGYHNAWVALLDESGRLEANAEAGWGEDFLPMLERLKRGEMPSCGRKAMSQPGIVVTEDPSSTCTDCPVSAKCGGRGTITVRLEYGGKVYGLSSVSVPAEFVADEEEQKLFQEVAGDIAFALHNMELEEERKRAEEHIKHLNSVLKAIRTVNQLVVMEKDRDTLLQKACDALIEARGYDAAWLGFVSGGGENFATVKGSGFGESITRFCEDVMGGDHPPCIRNALAQKEKFMRIDRSRECEDCSFKDARRGKEAAIIRVEHADRLFGLLAVLLAPDVAVDDEEKGLLIEVAGDIAFALHDTEMEEARKRAEEELKHTALLLQEHVEKLEEAKRRVEEACSLREHFLKETSHRIITPVAIIGGCAQLLLESRDLDEDQKKKIRIMQTRNEEVQKLVRDALAGKYLEKGEE